VGHIGISARLCRVNFIVGGKKTGRDKECKIVLPEIVLISWLRCELTRLSLSQCDKTALFSFSGAFAWTAAFFLAQAMPAPPDFSYMK
jgi:hypothetical protein